MSTPWGNETQRADWYKDQYGRAVEALNKCIIPDDSFGSLCICAVRYCIGRQTYMPGLIQSYLRPMLDLLDKKTLVVMRNDIQNADNYGDEKIDKPGWIRFLADIEAELENRK
jgi:hypothetical protein